MNDNIGVFINSYINDVTNLIAVEGQFDRVFQGLPVDFAEVPVNKGEVLAYGGSFRINAKYNIGNNSYVNGYVAYSYSDGKVDDSLRIPYSAQNTIKCGIDLKIKKFSISPRMIYRTESIHGLLMDTNGDYIKNEPFALVNVAARYKIIDSNNFKLAFYTKILNALDARYYNLPYGKEELFNAIPQDPIRIMGGVQIGI